MTIVKLIYKFLAIKALGKDYVFTNFQNDLIESIFGIAFL